MKLRKGGSEAIPLIQGKEQRLRYAGAALKRHLAPEARGSDPDDHPEPEAKASSLEEQLHVQGAVAASKEWWLHGRQRA